MTHFRAKLLKTALIIIAFALMPLTPNWGDWLLAAVIIGLIWAPNAWFESTRPRQS